MHFILVMLKYYKGTTGTANETETVRPTASEENSVLTIASGTITLTAASVSTSVMITEPAGVEASAQTEEMPPEVQDRRKSTGMFGWLSK